MTKAVKQYIVGGDTNATARAARLQGVQDWCKRAGLDRIPSHGPHYKESQQAGDMAARQACRPVRSDIPILDVLTPGQHLRVPVAL